MIRDEPSETLLQIIRLRHLVGFLGERFHCGWWPTAFYEPSSRLFLEPVFTKTSALAQYHGVVEAARNLHDERLSVGSYHLFRLPEEIEQDLHEMVQMGSDDLVMAEMTATKETALEALGKSVSAAAQEAVGPILVGNIEAVRTLTVLNSITEIYHAALSSGTQAFPYLAR